MKKRGLWTVIGIVAAAAVVFMFSGMSIAGNGEWWFGWSPGNRVYFLLVLGVMCFGGGLVGYMGSGD